MLPTGTTTASAPLPRPRRSTRSDDEASLVALARSGDRTAATNLFTRHIQPTHRYFARRIACAADTEDLVQRTLLAAMEGLPRLREGASFTGFVRAIARRLSLRHCRDGERARKRLEADVQPETLMAREPSMSASILREEAQDRLRRALCELPESSARVLRLRYWDERDATEIARVLDSSPEAVRVRLHRARRQIEHVLMMSSSSHADVWPLDGA